MASRIPRRLAGNDHFHFEKTAERRSWVSMASFLKDSFAGKGQLVKECAKFVPPKRNDPKPGTPSNSCLDDDAAVEAKAGAWGVKKCAANLCEGQYKDMLASLCMKTCGLCKVTVDCADDDAGVEKAAGSWGIKKCAANLCMGQYKDMMQPLCKKTCGLCKMTTTQGGYQGVVSMACDRHAYMHVILLLAALFAIHDNQ